MSPISYQPVSQKSKVLNIRSSVCFGCRKSDFRSLNHRKIRYFWVPSKKLFNRLYLFLELVDVPGHEHFSYLGQKTQMEAPNQAKLRGRPWVMIVVSPQPSITMERIIAEQVMYLENVGTSLLVSNEQACPYLPILKEIGFSSIRRWIINCFNIYCFFMFYSCPGVHSWIGIGSTCS